MEDKIKELKSWVSNREFVNYLATSGVEIRPLLQSYAIQAAPAANLVAGDYPVVKNYYDRFIQKKLKSLKKW